jgi:ligand-binding sensor domain-containing protein
MVDSTKAQWFGTQKGVSIHEGSQTRTGWTKFTTPDGLVDNYITAIAADHSGRYWIGTRNGLSVYSNNNFMNYSENTALQDQMINDIVFAGDGTGWLASSSGLISLNIDGTEPVWSESGVLKGSGVFALLFDSYETLWVGTSNNMYTFNNGSRIYENDLVEFDGLKVNDICETNPSEIYVATDKGVYKINMKQN